MTRHVVGEPTGQLRCASRQLPTATARRDSVTRLRAENDELRAKVWKLEERFILATDNAWAENIDKGLLYRPLPPLDRAASKSGRERRTRGLTARPVTVGLL